MVPKQPAPGGPMDPHRSLPQASGGTRRRSGAIPGYEILGELGRGGMGIVFKARHLQLDRVVALKVMIAGEDATEEALVRFQREARAAAKLDHPNIVPIHDVGREGSKHYFTMRFVEGEPLSLRAKKKGITPRQALEWTRKLALALAYAHSHGVIHRDVKPGNILIDGAGEPHLVDFGLAKDVEVDGVTAPGTKLGSPSYAPPEQLDGRFGSADARADVYSLGATLYHMLTGDAPFRGDRVFTIVMGVLFHDPDPPRSVNPNIHRDVETICLKALEKDPARRYQSAQEMAEDIARYLDGEPIRAVPATWGRRLARGAKKNVAAVLAASAVLLLVCGFGVRSLIESRLRSRQVGEIVSRAGTCEREGDDATVVASRRKERYMSARDLLRDARHLDETDPEVREALGRVEAKLALVSRQEDDTRVDAEKTRLVTGVLWRWSGVVDAVRVLDGAFHDSRGPQAAQDTVAIAAWVQVQRFMEDTPADPTSQATMKALSCWARRLARDASAMEELRRARDLDSEVPYPRLVEAMTLLAAYQDERPLPRLAWGPTGLDVGPQEEETPAMAEAREGMEKLLQEASGASRWAGQAAAEFAPAVEGIRSTRDGDLAKAEESLSRALGAPTMKSFEAEIRIARAHARVAAGDFDGALSDLDEAARIRPAQDEVALLRARARLLRANGSPAPSALVQKAIADLDACLARNKEFARGYELRGAARLMLGDLERGATTGKKEHWSLAISDLGEAIRRSSQEERLLRMRAFAWLRMGEYEAGQRGDPKASYERALADCGAALALAPASPDALDVRGTVQARLGAYEEAVADHGRVLKQDPARIATIAALAEELLRCAELEEDHGRDPREAYAGAIEQARRVIDLRKDEVDARIVRGEARLRLGAWGASQGQDPCAVYEQAGLDAEAVLERSSSHAGAHRLRAACYAKRGEWEAAQGKDPTAWYAKAEEALGRVSTSEGLTAGTQALKGLVARGKGEWLAGTGKDPESSYAAADRALTNALRMRSTDWKLWMERGRVRAGLAAWKGAQGDSALKPWRDALADLDQAIKIAPGIASAYLERGRIGIAYGGYRERTGGDPRETYEGAAADLGEALTRVPELVEALRGRAFAHLRRGFGAQGWRAELRCPALAASEKSWLEKAQTDLDELLRRDPRDATSYLRRALASEGFGIVEARAGRDPSAWFHRAKEDYTRAVEASSDPSEVRFQRGRGQFWLSQAVTGRSDALANARGDLEAVVEKTPTRWEAHLILGRIYAQQGRWDLAVVALERVAATRDPDAPAIDAEVEQARAAWGGKLGARRSEAMMVSGRAQGAMRTGDYATAWTEYERLLGLLEGPSSAGQVEATMRSDAHLALARIHALASAGRSAPGALADPVDPDRADALRDRAFEHLESWLNLHQIRENPATMEDLAPLHDDPRWAVWAKRFK